MNVRAFREYDNQEAYKVWYAFFRDEFEFPEFLVAFHFSFVIENDNEPIVFGGVRPIAELIAVTNKNASKRERVTALKKLVEVSCFIAKNRNYDQLHCFVQGDSWSSQVQTIGFRPTRGQALVMDVE